jgi:hypothetical protein
MVTRRRSAAYEIEGYVIPSGLADVAPDVDPLLRAHGWAARTGSATTVLASPAPTTASCAVASSDALAAGDGCAFVIEGTRHARVVATSDNGVITWSPPLPAPPSAGDVVSGTTAYRPTARPDTSVTLWRDLDGVVFAYPGCVGKLTEIVVSSGDEARIRLEGAGADEGFASPDATTAAVTAQETALAVTDVRRFSAGMPLWLGTEAVRVTRVADDWSTLTVERGLAGTTAVGHDAGTKVAARIPASSLRGSPVAGVTGRVIVEGAAFEITKAVLRVEEGLAMREVFGREGPSGFTYPDRRRVSLTLTGYLTTDRAGHVGGARRFEALEVFVQAGERAGNAFAFHAPRFEPRWPEIAAEAGREVPLELTGVCLETAGDDEVRLLFA